MKKELSVYVLLFSFLIQILISCHKGPDTLPAGFTEPADPDSIPVEAWSAVKPGLHATIGSIDKRYSRSVPPEISISETWEGSAWRGERTNIQVILWSSGNIENISITSGMLEGQEGHLIDDSNITVHLVRYVITDEFLGGCGYRDHDTIPAHLVADPFENTNVCNLPAKTCRPVWITIDVPEAAAPDRYKGTVTITYSKGSEIDLELNLLVQAMILPPPAEWAYHLDLWLNPFAIARYHQVRLWSGEFWDRLKPYVMMLADAGQKSITACIIDDPWKTTPVYDEYKSMIKRIKKSGGQWEYDYTVFDRYVRLIHDCGIKKQINCFTMATWGDEYRYFDEDSSGFVSIKTVPGDEEYTSFWKPFLISFSAHLKEMGWIDKTCIAMDERSPRQIKNIMALLEDYAPDLKVAMAIDSISPDLNLSIYDISAIAHSPLDTGTIRERIEKGLLTTFYTCCAAPENPNNFSFSPPSDAAWLGWYAAARGYEGFLRFAYCSWTKDPLMDSRYVTWPAGDCYQIYPGPRSSIRFERLREGIQDYEKIRIIRSKLLKMNTGEAKAALKELDDFLENFTIETLAGQPSEKWVNEGNKLLDRLSE